MEPGGKYHEKIRANTKCLGLLSSGEIPPTIPAEE